MTTTTIFNWLDSTASGVSTAITYLVRGTTRAPASLSPAEKEEVDMRLTEEGSGNTSMCVFEWEPLSIGEESPTLNAEQMEALKDALNTPA